MKPLVASLAALAFVFTATPAAAQDKKEPTKKEASKKEVAKKSEAAKKTAKNGDGAEPKKKKKREGC